MTLMSSWGQIWSTPFAPALERHMIANIENLGQKAKWKSMPINNQSIREHKNAKTLPSWLANVSYLSNNLANVSVWKGQGKRERQWRARLLRVQVFSTLPHLEGRARAQGLGHHSLSSIWASLIMCLEFCSTVFPLLELEMAVSVSFLNLGCAFVVGRHICWF